MQLTPEQIELRKLEARLTKRFHKACADYALIEDGDHILIGLSGGKDSLALVEMLGRRAKIYVPRFRVSALHVRMRDINYVSDTQYLERFCQEHGVELIVREAQIVGGLTTLDRPTIDPRETHGRPTGDPRENIGKDSETKNPCFLCSWYRRKMLFDVAQELGCNKIALGHHKDDIVETLLMNLISQGAFATIPPKLQMEKMPLQLVRPLCLMEESDLARYAELRGYQKQQKLCPYEKVSSRSNVKQLVAQLKILNPNALDSIWGAMSNIKHEYLPHK